MSNFMQEAKGSGFPGAELAADEVPQSFIRMLNAALKSPLLVVPKPFETWMIDKVASSGFDLPISQIVGFQQFMAQAATKIASTEATTSTSYTDLTTVGPTLTGLPDGQYLIFHGCQAKISVAAGDALMSFQVNATAATDADLVGASGTVFYSVSSVATKTLSNGGNNTITAKYRVGTALNTGTFAFRWLIALRVSN